MGRGITPDAAHTQPLEPAMIHPRTTTVIANPRAGGRRVARQWDALLRAVHRELGALMVIKTQHPGHARQLAAEATQAGSRIILSLGGDGTHHEVINGIMEAQPEPGAVAFGVLPSGTGGDFGRLLIGQGDLESTLWALRRPEGALVDVGLLRHQDHQGRPARRWFLNLTSFGIGGLIDQLANASSKRLGGELTFAAATARAFFQYKPATVELTLDGQALGTRRVMNVIAANGRYSGGGMRFAPEGRLNDGLLDFVVIQAGPIHQMARLFAGLHSGAFLRHRLVDAYQGRRLEATPVSGGPALLDVDGEALGVLPATVEVVPGALRLLNPLPQVLCTNHT
jgi:YegS/Rv2252/BmrU family lipid kinase